MMAANENALTQPKFELGITGILHKMNSHLQRMLNVLGRSSWEVSPFVFATAQLEQVLSRSSSDTGT